MPFIREPQPDDRPSRAEVIFAAALFIFVLIASWLVAVLTGPLP